MTISMQLLLLFAALTAIAAAFRNQEGMVFPAVCLAGLSLIIPIFLLAGLDPKSFVSLLDYLCCHFYVWFPAFVVIGIANATHSVVTYRKKLDRKLEGLGKNIGSVDDAFNYGAISGLQGVPLDLLKIYVIPDATSPLGRQLCTAIKVLSTPSALSVPYYCSFERSSHYMLRYSVNGAPLVWAKAVGKDGKIELETLIVKTLSSYYSCKYPSLILILDAILFSSLFWWVELFNPLVRLIGVKTT